MTEYRLEEYMVNANTTDWPKIWAVVPAAGHGSRMQSDVPKQYMTLANQPVLQRTIDTLLSVNNLQKVLVVIQPDDQAYFNQLSVSCDNRVQSVAGAELRARSVANGIEVVREQAGDDVWVIVHDAARPLVVVDDIHNLIQCVVRAQAIGGLLGTPVQDTLKQANQQTRSERTVSREHLWQAQTPQLFRAGALSHALSDALEAMTVDGQTIITDEASAFERLGQYPMLVESRWPNLKITRPQDLALAEALLATREP